MVTMLSAIERFHCTLTQLILLVQLIQCIDQDYSHTHIIVLLHVGISLQSRDCSQRFSM